MMAAALNQIVVSPDKWMLNVTDPNLSGISVHGNIVQVQRRAPHNFTYKFWNERYEIPENFNFSSTSFVGEIFSVVAKSVNPPHHANEPLDELGRFVDNVINVMCAMCALFYVSLFFYCKWSAAVHWYIWRNYLRIAEFIFFKIFRDHDDVFWFWRDVKMILYPMFFTIWFLICFFKPESQFLDKYVCNYQDSLASMIVLLVKSMMK